jgi:hypothetical protein
VRAFRPTLAIAASCVLASDASAQLCLGHPSFDAGRVQIGANVSRSERATAVAAGVTLGSRSIFGGLSLGALDQDGISGQTLLLGAGLGYQLIRRPAAPFQLCLGASGSVGTGPKNVAGSNQKAYSESFVIGLSAALVINPGSVQRLVPTFGVGYAGSRFQASRDDFATSTFDRSDKFTVIDVGVGFIVTRTLALRPSLTFPLGLEGSTPVLGLDVALNIGRRR